MGETAHILGVRRDTGPNVTLTAALLKLKTGRRP